MKTIFLIDDDHDDAGLFREAVNEIDPGLEVKHFENVPDALKALQLNTRHPHFIFLDINLPIVNGWQFLKQLKEDFRFAAIPVIIYSTSSQLKEKEIANELGAVGFITKPNDYQEIKQELSTYLLN